MKLMQKIKLTYKPYVGIKGTAQYITYAKSYLEFSSVPALQFTSSLRNAYVLAVKLGLHVVKNVALNLSLPSRNAVKLLVFA